MSHPVAVAVDARISSGVAGKALGVNRQLADSRVLAEAEGWTIAEEYVDTDISATAGKRRPAYDAMLEDLADGMRDGVILYDLDGLSRRPIGLEQFVDVVTAARVRHVQFVAGVGADLASGDGLMMARMIGAIAASNSHSVRRKMDEVAASRRPHGGTRPFGFEDDKVTHRSDEAEILRTLADRYLAGESLRSLAAWLVPSGSERCTSRKLSWSRATAASVLNRRDRHSGTLPGKRSRWVGPRLPRSGARSCWKGDSTSLNAGPRGGGAPSCLA